MENKNTVTLPVTLPVKLLAHDYHEFDTFKNVLEKVLNTKIKYEIHSELETRMYVATFSLAH